MNIEDIEQSAIEEINKVENVPALNELKGKLLGKKSKLSSVFSMMKDLPIEEKKKFGEKVNQVKVKITEYLQEKQKELETAIENEILLNNLDCYVFMVTDILNASSKALVLGNRRDVFEKAYNTKLFNNTAFLDGVVSRKKQVLPKMLEVIK